MASSSVTDGTLALLLPYCLATCSNETVSAKLAESQRVVLFQQLLHQYRGSTRTRSYKPPFFIKGTADSILALVPLHNREQVG